MHYWERREKWSKGKSYFWWLTALFTFVWWICFESMKQMLACNSLSQGPFTYFLLSTQLFDMEERRRVQLGFVATLIQKTYRGWKCRTHFLLLKKSQVIIAAWFKRYNVRMPGLQKYASVHIEGLHTPVLCQTWIANSVPSSFLFRLLVWILDLLMKWGCY